ncbi:MAG: acetyl-CoA carboxylase biotin carboxyl carrier protein [Bacteroidetes bacterium]|nr:acetyl-CoA carboxylase biotin carboxyl carrier protein [Bacteroidota bacterium]
MKLSEIQELIKFVAKSGVSEIELEIKDFKITIKTPPNKRRGQKDVPDLVVQAATPFVEEVVTPVAAMAQPVVATTPATQLVPVVSTGTETIEENGDESGYTTIKAPMIGTFYRASDPEKPPFVNVGDVISTGTTICIIEAMKLFNEIESEVSGKIVKVLVDDTSPVEYDQPLFLIDPNA